MRWVRQSVWNWLSEFAALLPLTSSSWLLLLQQHPYYFEWTSPVEWNQPIAKWTHPYRDDTSSYAWGRERKKKKRYLGWLTELQEHSGYGTWRGVVHGYSPSLSIDPVRARVN